MGDGRWAVCARVRQGAEREAMRAACPPVFRNTETLKHRQGPGGGAEPLFSLYGLLATRAGGVLDTGSDFDGWSEIPNYRNTETLGAKREVGAMTCGPAGA
ncbi:MAG: hypothetical protein RI897_3600 [Verrucomicrobiota bacterium]|jgi:hypothetical protein